MFGILGFLKSASTVSWSSWNVVKIWGFFVGMKRFVRSASSWLLRLFRCRVSVASHRATRDPDPSSLLKIPAWLVFSSSIGRRQSLPNSSAYVRSGCHRCRCRRPSAKSRIRWRSSLHTTVSCKPSAEQPLPVTEPSID